MVAVTPWVEGLSIAVREVISSAKLNQLIANVNALRTATETATEDSGPLTAPVVFQNGWGSFTSAGWESLRVRKIGKLVILNGGAAKASYPGNDIIATLTAPYRPPFQTQGVNCVVDTLGVIRVGAAGTVGATLSAAFYVA